MNCPECNKWTYLLETRERPAGTYPAGTYRRYECGNLHRFTTINDVVVRVDKGKLTQGRPRKAKPDAQT